MCDRNGKNIEIGMSLTLEDEIYSYHCLVLDIEDSCVEAAVIKIDRHGVYSVGNEILLLYYEDLKKMEAEYFTI